MEKMEKYLGQLLDNRYELLEIIGSGGMAVVFKARCHRLNRYVAVKILRAEFYQDEVFRQRFQAESRAVAQLSHPNIVGVYDVSHSDTIEYIVMELLEGNTLKQYLREKGPLRWEEMLRITTQIASAMDHAHSKGIIHRDIKPQNIMILKDGTAKVADFGIASLQNEAAAFTGETMGSVHYISPEQARGQGGDARSDIYSLGVVMYEMLSCQLPFDDPDEMKIPLMHLSTVPTPLSELNPQLPPELIDITMKAMAPDPEDRYQSASKLLRDLDSFRRRKNNERLKAIEGNVLPMPDPDELPRDKYLLRKKKAQTVSVLSGFLGVLLFVLLLGVFLWDYWLKDLFSVAQRVVIPDFVGSNYEAIINSSSYGSFNFTCEFQINPDAPEGQIISQSPSANKSYMLTDTGVNVELTISTGIVMYEIPDYTRHDYMEASVQLEKMGFKVEKIFENHETVTNGYVISINPMPGEKLPAGSTVYLLVSNGPVVQTVLMPNLVGKNISAAQEQLEAMKLSLMPLIYVSSDEFPEGQVISQTVEAGLEVETRTKVYLTVSTGPEKQG